ncbi:hypothetical protein VTK73DRAFT_5941 [Phialemonium thermophilum]|uniref:Zn(2)-C6 fungal-type domain-containing protein n=1 Tax=Phialemonium thermophilum TaxID=223376 RepID=A0ABR3WL69_9PEZI
MRSVTGCLTCRRRKLKCDEKRPECGQCRKSGRVCQPNEVVFRHQQSPSVRRGRERSNSFSASDTWLTIPETVSFVAVDPSPRGGDKARGRSHSRPIEGGSPFADLCNQGHPLETVEGQRGDLDLSSPGSAPADHLSPQSVPSSGTRKGTLSSDGVDVRAPTTHEPGLPSNIELILNPSTSQLSRDDARGYRASFSPPDSFLSPADLFGLSGTPQAVLQRAHPVETDPEVAFLLRHFSEQPGRWLDLYFSDAYFALEVPIKALSHPLLKSAACAYAAKHLSRTRRKTDAPKVPLRQSNVATTTTWPNSDSVDWAWYGAKYYAQAINLLRETLENTHDLLGGPLTGRGSAFREDGSEMQPAEQYATYDSISDETLAAMAILCNFEFMSASDVEWTRHLNGTLLVLDLRQTGVISLMSSPPSKARKSIFWNLFRQDVFAAFILEGRTRLDIDDLRMLRAAGLQLDDHGFVLPSAGSTEGGMKEDMISNALIWILSKVINYIAAMKELQQQETDASRADDGSSGGSMGGSRESPWTLRDKWKSISRELDVWYEGLPDTFQPCARIERKTSEPATESSPPKPATIPDIWFTSAMCASTIQTYHLARMLLLIHRPQSVDAALRTGAVFDFLNIYRKIEAELRYRSREIFGIALSSPTTSITLHQTQTIFVAAQCLVEDEERHMALDILRRANSDLGWETEYRVQQLIKEWGWTGV